MRKGTREARRVARRAAAALSESLVRCDARRPTWRAEASRGTARRRVGAKAAARPRAHRFYGARRAALHRHAL